MYLESSKYLLVCCNIDVRRQLCCYWPRLKCAIRCFFFSSVLGWCSKYPDMDFFKPVSALNRLVSDGKLGCKSGEGFYKYDNM